MSSNEFLPFLSFRSSLDDELPRIFDVRQVNAIPALLHRVGKFEYTRPSAALDREPSNNFWLTPVGGYCLGGGAVAVRPVRAQKDPGQLGLLLIIKQERSEHYAIII